MEVDVRLIILAILYVMITAQDDDSRVDLTDKLLYHCAWCLRNLSSAACRILDNGTLSCVKCKEYIVDDLLCEQCPSSVDGSVTGLRKSCNSCVCNGTIGAKLLKSCTDVDHSRCFVCQLNETNMHCKQCINSNQGLVASSFQGKLCSTTAGDDKIEPQKKSGFSTKEKIIVTVCSVFGAACLVAISFWLYRLYKSKRYTMKKPFWTVELTNRNYDDLDFSLLNPITDVPFVYRTDVDEFDNEALLASEKPQLVMDVDAGNIAS